MNIKLKLPEGYLEEEERCGYTISAERKSMGGRYGLLAELDRVMQKASFTVSGNGRYVTWGGPSSGVYSVG